MNNKIKPTIIGICGGSGSGKSTIVKEISNLVPKHKLSIIEEDSYYKDQSDMSFSERLKTDYDHPSAFDHELMNEHIGDLISGKSINKPIYNFEENNRTKDTILVEPTEVIIIEGLMILFEEKIRDLLDIKVYIDTDSDMRIIRRVLRDINERGRTAESVITQYLKTVRPAHFQFIEPSKRYADIIIPEGGQNKVAIELLRARIAEILKQ